MQVSCYLFRDRPGAFRLRLLPVCPGRFRSLPAELAMADRPDRYERLSEGRTITVLAPGEPDETPYKWTQGERIAFGLAHFNDYDAANRVTAKGRELIQQVMAWLRGRGATVIEVDTDGLYVTAPPDVRSAEDAERLLQEMGSVLPAGISLELAGRYPAMFSYKMKFVAERFGALPRGKTMGPERMESLPKQFGDTPIWDETVREAMIEKLMLTRQRR
jgi:hypothetical protein